MGRLAATSMTAADIWGHVGPPDKWGPERSRRHEASTGKAGWGGGPPLGCQCTLAIVRTTARIGLVLSASVFLERTAAARHRPLFEPTDLEMEDCGTMEVDLQFGLVRGREPW